MGSLPHSAPSALCCSIEGGSAEHASMGIVSGSSFGAGAFEVKSKAQGGTVRIKGDGSSFTGNKGVAIGVVGNSCHITVRCVMCIRFVKTKHR